MRMVVRLLRLQACWKGPVGALICGSSLLILVMMALVGHWTATVSIPSVLAGKPAPVVFNPKLMLRPIKADEAARTNRRFDEVRKAGLPAVRDLYDPGFLIPNPAICHGRPGEEHTLKLLIIVPSAAKKKVERTAVRQTWGDIGAIPNVRVAYLFGKTLDQDQQRIILEETEQFGDIIQTANMDGYNNFTLKTTAMLQWIKEYCPQVTFVLKADDDVFINLPGLLRFLDHHQHDSNTIFGRCSHGYQKVVRNKKSKFYIPSSEYPADHYPTFCTGPAYLMTSDAASRLYEGVLDSIFLKNMEDVLVTGIVAEKSGVTRMHVPEFRNVFPEKWLPSGCDLTKTISYHGVPADGLYKLWNILQNTSYVLCN